MKTYERLMSAQSSSILLSTAQSLELLCAELDEIRGQIETLRQRDLAWKKIVSHDEERIQHLSAELRRHGSQPPTMRCVVDESPKLKRIREICDGELQIDQPKAALNAILDVLNEPIPAGTVIAARESTTPCASCGKPFEFGQRITGKVDDVSAPRKLPASR